MSYRKTIVLSFLVYFFSYAMRLDYSASLVAMVQDLKISNIAASAAVTGSFITYGLGQIVCGFIGDKISPVKMISFAMLGTIIVNLSVSFCSSVMLITVLWCINGVFQAMLWPPLTRFLAERIGEKKYADAVTSLGLSASTGTIFVYLFVPFVLKFTVWRNVFRCMAVFGLIIMCVWVATTKNIKMGRAETVVVPQNIETVEKQHSISVLGLISLAGLIPLFVVISLQGILRDGIQTWLPSLMSEKFMMNASSSVLSTAVLPVLSMISVLVSNTIYKAIKNEIKTAAMMFGIAFLATVPLGTGIKIPALLTVVFASLISACMHGVNHMIICVIPKHFSKYGLVSTFSGILNAFTYVGASLSTYGFAALSDNFGWNSVIIGWCIIAFLGTMLCTLKIKSWTKFIAE